MSISDNEDLDTKPSAGAGTRRRHEKGHHSSSSSSSAAGNDDDAASLKVETKKELTKRRLTAEEQREISYRRTMALLTSSATSCGGGGEADAAGEITVIPSLVSLSEAFFRVSSMDDDRPNVPRLDEKDVRGRSKVEGDDGGEFGWDTYYLPRPRHMADTFDRVAEGRRRRSGPRSPFHSHSNSPFRRPPSPPVGPQGAPLPPPSLYEGSRRFVRSGRSAGAAAMTAAATVAAATVAAPSALRRSASGADDSIGTTAALQRAASLPLTLADAGGAAAAAVDPSESESESDSIAVTAQQQPPQPSQQPQQQQLDPNRFLSTVSSPDYLHYRRVRDNNNNNDNNNDSHNNDNRNNNTNILDHRNGDPPAPVINAVQSLSEAVKRLDQRLKERENFSKMQRTSAVTGAAASSSSSSSPGTPSHSNANAADAGPMSPVVASHAHTIGLLLSHPLHDIDELESRTVTRLAEIMLHPPQFAVGEDGYMWDDEEEEEDHCHDGNGRAVLSFPSFDCPAHPAARYPSSLSAHLAIASLGSSIPRRVCQHPFRRNDIVWVCRTCQSDETCVLCHDCFVNSNHDGHDVAFYHAQAGGCCDCGDPDAWDPNGFCPKHGPAGDGGAPPGTAVAAAEPSVCGAVHACADWLVQAVQSSVDDAYRRANPRLFPSARGRKKVNEASRGDSFLPEYYEQGEGGRDRREKLTLRRDNSLTRRNTVADVESHDVVLEDVDAGERNSNDDDAVMSETEPISISNRNVPSTPESPSRHHLLHEFSFDPSAASKSKKWSGDSPLSKRDAANDSSEEMFDPLAASSTKESSPRAAKKAKAPPEPITPARALGDLGREQRGLFLVLHSDDVRVGATSSSSSSEVMAALKELYSTPGGARAANAAASANGSTGGGAPSSIGFTFSRGGGMVSVGNTRLQRHRHHPRGLNPSHYSPFRAPYAEAILSKIIAMLQKHGDIIVWGTQELLAECGDVTARLWRDGDATSSTLVGAAMLNRAKILTDHGLVCSIKTLTDLQHEQTATAVISLIGSLARSCDPLCHQVSAGISGAGISSTLPPLLRSDLKLPQQFTSSWHSLLLTLLAVPDFKAALANAYCDTYRMVTAEYARGIGRLEQSLFTLSVQFLNRVTYVRILAKERNLLANLSRSLLETMRSASFLPGAAGSPLPAGASADMMLDEDAVSDPSSSLTAAALAILGYFALAGGDENAILLELDSEISDILRSANGDAGGGDSRYHGRSALSRRWREGRSISATSNELSDLGNRFNDDALVPPTLNPNHHVLTNRRYSPCISDLKCVLNVAGMARHFAALPMDTSPGTYCALDDWISTLAVAQMMDGQMWRSWAQGHVETEPKGWVGAFNASISLGSLFERLLLWEDSDPTPIGIGCATPVRLLSCVELTHYTLTTGVHRWQRLVMLSYRPSPPPSPGSQVQVHSLCPASLPFSTVAVAHGSSLAMAALPLSQTKTWSFHLPLHRFVSTCIREVCRRGGGNLGISGGIEDLLKKFHIDDIQSKEGMSKLRLNALLFRGLMEFPTIVLSRAAQIRAGLWKRNGPGMQDQVLNYSEPPFCRSLQDADLVMIQFSLLCHTVEVDESYMSTKINNETNKSMSGLAFQRAGTLRFVNLLLHRFGVFDFLGFRKAPDTDVARYQREINEGLYPAEISLSSEKHGSPSIPNLPWTSSPAKDVTTLLVLVEELLHLVIILITEMPTPPPRDKHAHAMDAKRRLRREVVHRLASGSKTHSELAEVHHVLPQRDNHILSEEGKLINPDDASGAALEEVLQEVGCKKPSHGKLSPELWELQKWAWKEYDPAFHHISTRAHQTVAECRPKDSSGSSIPYAPRPSPAHSSFKRLRRDLTADSSILAVTYRLLHVHCCIVDSPKPVTNLQGKSMYEHGAKSETALARAVHILTLGAFTWEEDIQDSVDENGNSSWRIHGGGDLGSVFFDRLNQNTSAPTVRDWVDKALLRNPQEVMNDDWYKGEENALLLLNRLSKNQGSFSAQDHSLRLGAAWLCDFATKWNPDAAALLGKSSVSSSGGKAGAAIAKNEEMERRQQLAKEKALAKMQAQMANFAKMMDSTPSFDEDDEVRSRSSSKDRGESIDQAFSTPTRRRSDTTELMDVDSSLDQVDIILTPPPPSSPYTPKSGTPRSRSGSRCTTPRGSHNSCARLLDQRPQCIICGTDTDTMQVETSSTGETSKDKALAFCGYAQASTIAKGGGGVPPNSDIEDSHSYIQRHVGVHITLCGHAIHSSCCESYLKSVSQRDERLFDRLEGGKRGEFHCPMCQRLSNILIPFIDVGVDWVQSTESDFSSRGENDEDDGMISNSAELGICSKKTNKSTLDDFLRTTKWWAGRNDKTVVWDGRCCLAPVKEEATQESSDHFPFLSSPTRSLSKSVRAFGKKDLISAWNSVMRTPRRVRRPAQTPSERGFNPLAFPTPESDRKRKDSFGVTDVWRKLMDQIFDVAHRADAKRLGEDVLCTSYGEFRHHLTEKYVFNKLNRTMGKELLEWPMCISSTTLTDTRRQELSREKLISKLLFSIQSFTYSCCSEAAEVRRLFRNGTTQSDPDSSEKALLSKFGISGVELSSGVVMLPDSHTSADGDSQPFDGRMGKLRYLGLALMAATSPVCREVMQLCMSFPLQSNADPFDFDAHIRETEEKERAPIVYPILCGHVLTHTTSALCAIAGQARTQSDFPEMIAENGLRVRNVIHESQNIVQIGLIARIIQVILAHLRMAIVGNLSAPKCNSKMDRTWEEKILSAVLEIEKELNIDKSSDEYTWKLSCLMMIKASMPGIEGQLESSLAMNCSERADLKNHVINGIEVAKGAAVEFLRDISVIMQILTPNIFSKNSTLQETKMRSELTPTVVLKSLLTIHDFDFDMIANSLKSELLIEVIANWYVDASQKKEGYPNRIGLDFPEFFFRGMDWPQTPFGDRFDRKSSSMMPSTALPLLGGYKSTTRLVQEGSLCQISWLPKSYTDLYAELGSVCPDSDQTALCLVCGQVLNASGKSECTKHAFKCGGGAGIFFLLQECVGLIMHGVKAAYIHSPYVDSHGETNFRGRPLNLDLDRYNILLNIWSGHLTRERVVAERVSTRTVIIANFY